MMDEVRLLFASTLCSRVVFTVEDMIPEGAYGSRMYGSQAPAQAHEIVFEYSKMDYTPSRIRYENGKQQCMAWHAAEEYERWVSRCWMPSLRACSPASP